MGPRLVRGMAGQCLRQSPPVVPASNKESRADPDSAVGADPQYLIDTNPGIAYPQSGSANAQAGIALGCGYCAPLY